MRTSNDQANRSIIKQRHEVDWSDDEQVVDFVTSRWENKDYYKRGLERAWLEVIAAYEGLPYLGYDEVYRRLVSDTKVPPWRVRLVVNLLLPYIRTAVAKHLRNRPTFDVLPATEDSNDYDIATVGKKALRSFWYQANVNYEFIDILLWMGLTGNAFAYVPWNPDIGPRLELEVRDFVQPNALYAAQDQETLTLVLQDASQKFEAFKQANMSNILPLGDNEIVVPTPFDMNFPWASNFYKAEWVQMAQLRSISHYADLGYDVSKFRTPTPKDARYVYYAKRVQNLYNIGVTVDASIAAEVNEQEILEIHTWLNPSRQFPKGYYCVVAGGEMIQKGENPYRHGQRPFIHFGTERTPGKVWHFSSASQALPVLKQYQKTKSQVVEIKNLMGKPKWLVSRAANIKQTAITSEPGEVIEYTGTLKPEAWHPPPIPRYFFDLMQFDRRDMDDIMAQRDATKGQNPAGVRAAASLVNLQQQDEGQLAIVGLNLNTGFSLAGRFLLSNYAQFVKEDRLVSYLGEKNRYQSAVLKRGSLEGKNARLIGADYFNVRVTEFSQFALTREGQMRMLETLLQYAVFTPTDRPKILQFVEMGYFEDQIDEFKKDRANAHQENLLMMQGIPAFVDVSDEHTIHRTEHEDYMKGDDYKRLPPQAKLIFIQHLHETKLAEVMKMLEPMVLTIPAKMMLAQQNGIPPMLLFQQTSSTTGEQNDTSRGSSSGSKGGSGKESSAGPNGSKAGQPNHRSKQGAGA